MMSRAEPVIRLPVVLHPNIIVDTGPHRPMGWGKTVSCDGGVPQYTAWFYSLLLTRHMLYVPT